MVKEAARAEKALQFGSVEVKVAVDTSDLEFAGRLVSDLSSASASVRIDTSDAELINSQKLIARLDSEPVNVRVDVADNELNAAVKKVDDLDTTAQVKVNAQDNTARTLSAIEGKLQNLETLATIDLVLNATQFLEQFASLPVIKQMAETEDAVARVNAQVEGSIPGAEHLINDIWMNGWGESKNQIADLIAKANGLGVISSELDDAANAALQFTSVWTEHDPTEVMETMDTMIKTGMVSSWQEAFDVLQRGQELGLNKGGELLTAFGEYGTALDEFGMSAEQSLAFYSSGIQAGILDTDKLGDSIRETNLRMRNMETATVDAINALGLSDELDLFNQGKITGAEMAGGIIEGLKTYKDMPGKPTAEQIAADIFGTQSEDFGLSSFLQLDFGGSIDYKGAGSEAAGEISDTLTAAATEFGNTLEVAVVGALDKAWDLSGMLDKAKEVAVSFSDAIQEGAGIGEAAEIALNLEEGSIQRLEGVLGSFVIGFAEAAAIAVELLGRDSSGIRATIADLAETQLAFDLQLARTAEEAAGLYETARDRGVSGEDTNAAILTAIDEMIAEGNTRGAAVLVENLGQIPDFDAVNTELSEFSQNIVRNSNTVDEAMSALQLQRDVSASFGRTDQVEQIDADMQRLEFAPTLDTTAWQGVIDESFSMLHTQLDAAVQAGDFKVAMEIGTEQLGFSQGFVAKELASAGLDSYEVPLDVSFDAAAFDPVMTGFTNEILTEMANTEAVVTEGGVQIEVAGARIVTQTEADMLAAQGTVATTTEDISAASVEVSLVSAQIVTDSDTAATATTEASGEMNTAFGLVAVGSAMLMVATGNYNALASAIQSSAPGMAAQLTEISDILNGFASVGSKALEVSAGVTGIGESGSTAGSKGNIGHAEGGLKPAGQGGWLGEQGPEWGVFGQDVSILNNQTSEALWTAMQSMGGRGGGGVTNNYYNNIVVTNHNASGAAVAGSNMALANQLRGFN